MQERKQGHLEADERVLDGDRELFSFHAGWLKRSVSSVRGMLFNLGGTHMIGANLPRRGSKRQSLATFVGGDASQLEAGYTRRGDGSQRRKR